MTVEELLKPRYKVLADYPSTPFEIGEILDLKKWNTALLEYKYFDSNEDANYLSQTILDKCSANFKKMNWWENRTIEDFKSIEYAKVVKSVGYWREGDVVPVERFEYSDDKPGGLVLKYDKFHALASVEPATEQQYIDFKKSPNN